jgi:hypothetical protein
LQLSFFFKPRPTMLLQKTVQEHLEKLNRNEVAVAEDLKVAYDDIFARNSDEHSFEYYDASKVYKMLLCSARSFSMTAILKAVALQRSK